MDEKKPRYKSIILLILDGWGISPSWGGNAISMNNPRIMSEYWKEFPHAILQAFKKVVGPSGKVGNSEIGHSSIGTCRIILQDMTRIGTAIEDGSFFDLLTLKEVAAHVKKNNSSLHIYGMLSDGAVHSHIDHAMALVDFAKKENISHLYVHCILDGRDSGALTGINYVNQLENRMKNNGVGSIASICGRFYAMDRDEHWSRISAAYQAMAHGVGERFSDAGEAITSMYHKGCTDEMMPPCVILQDGKPTKIENGDAVISFNFRADRARQMAQVFLGEKKLGMMFRLPKDLYFTGLTTYRLKSPMHTIFAPMVINNPLAKILSEAGMKQFHIAETEKYAHVTYFFNGGQETPFSGEDRFFVHSPDVVSYSQAPEMSARPLTDELVKRINTGGYRFLVANYANVDMVGHTGDINAAARAIGEVDREVGRVVEAAFGQESAVIITADHGNAEQMLGLHHDTATETMHTLNPVPFILIARDLHRKPVPSETSSLVSDIMKCEHTLADVAPTILDLYGLDKPTDMTGTSLLNQLE